MLLTYILLLTYRDGHALPVYGTPSSNTRALPWNSEMPEVIDTAHSHQQLRRTLFGVAWSCILTIFICAWTSVHPNVPPRGVMGGLLARGKLMFWTAVAPELVLAWAVRQWFAAREIRDLCWSEGNRRLKQWTMAHGYFLEMGGFTLVSDKIHQFKEPEEPEWLSTTTDEWDAYNEHMRQRARCQFGTLTLDRFEELVADPTVVFPDITAAQINDRSKGDGLSKLLAILQTSWFILQCIARGLQGLALTELELVTLAMASLNAITFAFWWNKPLSVQEPVHVYVPVPARVVAEQGDRNIVNDDEDNVVFLTAEGARLRSRLRRLFKFIARPQKYSLFKYTTLKGFLAALGLYLVLLPIALFSILTYPVFVLFPLGIVFLIWIIETKQVENAQDYETVATRVVLSLRRLRYKLTYPIRRYFGRRYLLPGRASIVFDFHLEISLFVNWFFFTPICFFLLILVFIMFSPLFAVLFIGSFTYTAAFEIVTSNTIRPGATHVPSFYAPRTASDKYSRMVIFAIFGVIFGGIHCIGWSFGFPTPPERFLWRYTSLALTAIPLIAAPIDFILENVDLNSGRGRRALQPLLAVFMTALLFLYVPARLSLIAQALALLRDQPADAYVAVNWTKYIPHLFS